MYIYIYYVNLTHPWVHGYVFTCACGRGHAATASDTSGSAPRARSGYEKGESDERSNGRGYQRHDGDGIYPGAHQRGAPKPKLQHDGYRVR